MEKSVEGLKLNVERKYRVVFRGGRNTKARSGCATEGRSGRRAGQAPSLQRKEEEAEWKLGGMGWSG